MTSLRVLIDPPASGEWNMAVDEALLETAASRGLATLRFYTWVRPTLSLGYFQTAADRHLHQPSLDCPVVRRSSGGGAIIHDRELTYSLAWPQRTDFGMRAGDLYDALHETLVETLAGFGVAAHLYRPGDCDLFGREPAAEPFLCFERLTCGDIICGSSKVAGSAQRRRRGAVLQHGSVLLACSPAAPELPGIAELTAVQLPFQALAEAWKIRIAARLHLPASTGQLDPDERQNAAGQLASRFASRDFLFRR